MNRLANIISLTTGVVLIYVIMTTLPISFSYIFLMFLISLSLFFWMVVAILKDKYTSNKTFDEYFYEDVEIKRNYEKKVRE